MGKLWSVIVGIFTEDDGVTSIEYALIGVLLSIMIVAGAKGIGTHVKGFFTDVVEAFP